jgi:regulator of replication initiation timing
MDDTPPPPPSDYIEYRDAVAIVTTIADFQRRLDEAGTNFETLRNQNAAQAAAISTLRVQNADLEKKLAHEHVAAEHWHRQWEKARNDAATGAALSTARQQLEAATGNVKFWSERCATLEKGR